MVAQMTKGEYIAQLVRDLDTAKERLEELKKEESYARNNTTSQLNSVNTLKKRLREAIGSLDLEDTKR